jgi:hypothetical protein
VNIPKYEFGLENPEAHEINLTGHCDGFFSGGPGGLGDAPAESMLNPRPLGFGRRDPFYIPVYWEPGE